MFGILSLMMDHQAAPQNQEAFFQELELSDKRNLADWNKSRREARLDGDLELVRKLEIEYDLAAEAPDAAVALLALTRKPVPMMCVEERLRRALEGGRAPPVLPAEEPPRIMRLEGDGSDPNAWVCVLPRRPLPKLSPEDWAKLREDRAIYHKDSDIKRHRGWLDEELAFQLPKLAAHHEAKTAAH